MTYKLTVNGVTTTLSNGQLKIVENHLISKHIDYKVDENPKSNLSPSNDRILLLPENFHDLPTSQKVDWKFNVMTPILDFYKEVCNSHATAQLYGDHYLIG